jgi:RNA polymerase sigma-70 factor (ECF subfamily)
LNESQLIISCQNGNKEAFNALIRLYYPYVSNFLIKLTSNQALSQDLIQETFVKLIRNIEKYDVKRDRSFASCIMAIAKNYYMDHLRKNKHMMLDVHALETADRLPPENRVLDEMQVSKILNELETLPFVQAQAIKMKYLEQMTLQEIAQRFNTETKTIKSR